MEKNEIEPYYKPKFNGGQRRGIVLEKDSNSNNFDDNTTKNNTTTATAAPPRAEKLQQKIFQFHNDHSLIGDQGTVL